MDKRIRRYLVVMAVGVAAVLPAKAQAQAPARARVEREPDGLSAQEREMLALAQDFARRSAEKMEAWIANKEVTREKLFSFLYFPVAKTDPPKFTTDWDKLSDRDVQAIEEAVLEKSPSIVFAVLVDRNGYLPTHNLRYSLPLTGNLASDLVNNRTKRIFNDRTGLAAARSEAPFLIQRYQRDTGENMVDLSVPVLVGGAHWGAVRIGYRYVEGR
jgi:methyl-accepting chemotaxis protein